MTKKYDHLAAFVSLGVASLALGSVGLLLFFLPILGIPLACIGLLFGLIALLAAIFNRHSGLRWSLLGIGLCILALAAEGAITHAAVSTPFQKRPHSRQAVPERYIPPPADPAF